jgi:hypothetical protein
MTAPVLKLEEGKLHKRPDLFGKVFAALIHDLTITDGAIRLYAHMHWRYGANHQMFESIGTMAKALGVTDRAIKQRIAELAAAGWIVVIGRREKGKVKSNFYHIFERTKDSRTFRKTYKPAPGEYVYPVPVIDARKTRKGVGGKNTHKAKEGDTQVPMAVAVGTQVPTEGDTQVPTNQTQVIQTHKSLVADATASDTRDAEQKPTKRGKQPPKPRGECDHEPVYEAVERYLFEITDATADDPYLWDSPQGFVTRWLLGRIAKLRKAELGKIRRPAEAHHVETFVRWYRGKYKDAALPTEVVKFVKHWRAFGAEMSAKNNKQNAAADKVSDMMALMAHDLGMTEPKGA